MANGANGAVSADISGSTDGGSALDGTRGWADSAGVTGDGGGIGDGVSASGEYKVS